MQPKNKSAINYIADDVWSAAVAAHRLNNGYIKAIAPGLNQIPNRDIVYRLLADPTSITSDDRSKAEIVRLYFKGQMFKVIEGKLSLQEQMEIGFPWSDKMVERSRRSAGATVAAESGGRLVS